MSPLDLFHPLVARWFRTVGEPTDVQEKAWPLIAAGRHVLVSAPTGTGKTLTAFLWGIDRLVRGAWPAGKVRILYVSPLKALNTDIRANLTRPLEELAALFREAGTPFPAIRAETRSGDTPQAERRRMLRRPPEVLITTPESLNLILSSPNARLMLDGVTTVILDEVHAVAGTKRGTHLILAVERLVRLAGEFQRIALSATVTPLSAVADFVGGYQVIEAEGGPGSETFYRKRPVETVSSPASKKYGLSVRWVGGPMGSDGLPGVDAAPGAAPDAAPGATPDAAPPVLPRPREEVFWNALAEECRREIAANRSTLFFVNSRRHAEKICRLVNEGADRQMVWAHHGSLSREIRTVVERRLKDGELPAIAATGSLELGIDIGSLDKVVLISTPFSVSAAVQRIGRSGHAVGEESRASLLPLHGRDLVDAAVMARAAAERDIEETRPVSCPLDVLAQALVSMSCTEPWTADGLFDAVRAAWPYRELPRASFDLVLGMLAGRYGESRLREMEPLVSWDRVGGAVRGRQAGLMRLYSSGGTIPDRGLFSLRTADTKALLGELDEEFVWERSVGDSFTMGTQAWRIQRIDHQNVEVVPVERAAAMAPFWKGEEFHRDFHLSERIALALEGWDAVLAEGRPSAEEGMVSDLVRLHFLDEASARELIAFLKRQREATGTGLPHRHRIVVEHYRDPSGTGDLRQVALHIPWGGRVLRPYGLALSAAWESAHGYKPEMIQTNDAVLLLLPDDARAADILPLVTAGGVEALLRKSLESSGFFGARFRENAGRALLLPRPGMGRRVPLWVTRLRSKSLLAAVSRHADFPILLETWRTCLRDEFDMDALRTLLEGIQGGDIRVEEAETRAPSPFCGDLTWKQVNTYMYGDDTPGGEGRTALREDLIREVALSPQVRPRIPEAAAEEYRRKVGRTAEGYAPRDAMEILDWLKERILVAPEEWEGILEAARRDAGLDPAAVKRELAERVSPVTLPGASGPAVAALEVLPRLRSAFGPCGGGAAAGAAPSEEDAVTEGSGPGEIVAEWLRLRGPTAPEAVQRLFGLSRADLDTILEDLVEEKEVVVDRLVADSGDLLLCDRENLETLLRICRARARPAFRPLPIDRLPLFLAAWQGLTAPGTGPEDMKRVWERLFGYPLPARLWEEEILPARLSPYRPAWLEELSRDGDILWFGCGKERLSFCFSADRDLFLDPPADGNPAAALLPAEGRWGFWDLHDRSGLPSADMAARLWDLVWAGFASADSFDVVRRGVAHGFRVPEAGPGSRGRPRRAGFDRWNAARPSGGLWFSLAPQDPQSVAADPLDAEERSRDRARALLSRWGVLFREMLSGELPALSWGRLFRTLRLMELSGEIVAGQFFSGVPGLQFASPAALDMLRGDLPEDSVYWMNAADPASPCGLGLEGMQGPLPPRLATTHLVFHGTRPVLAARRSAAEWDLRVPPESPDLPRYLPFLKVLAGRAVRPLSSVRVETVNGEPAARGPYRAALLGAGLREDGGDMVYEGGY